VFSAALMQGFQAGQIPPASGDDKDVYLIYSLMLTNPKTSHDQNNERYFIAATTAPGRPAQPCVVPPKDREADFREALADYELRKGKPRELKPSFLIPKRYVLLSADEVGSFRKDRWLSPEPKVPDARFLGVTDLFTLSDMYFNHSHTLALTGIGTWCGVECGSYYWKVFEKMAIGKWEERPWVACGTVAQSMHR
jgi:hypothetical protein